MMEALKPEFDEPLELFSTAKSSDGLNFPLGSDIPSQEASAATSVDEPLDLVGGVDTESKEEDDDDDNEMLAYVKQVVYETRGPLYLDLCSRTPPHLGALVKSFRTAADGAKGEAEKSGLVHIGDLVLSLNNVDCTVLPFQQIILEAKNAAFPLVMRVLPKLYVPEYFPITIAPSRHVSEAEPPSSTPNTRWGSFGQMLDIRTKRVSLTDSMRGSIASPPSGSTPPTASPVSTSSSAGWSQPPPTPQHNHDNFQQKFKLWQDSINLDKVMTSSSTLFKLMGGSHSGKKERDEWSQWLELATIAPLEPDNAWHTATLQLVSSGKAMGVEDGEVQCQWYRIDPDTPTQWRLLRGATHRTYQRSIDDLGATIAITCHVTRLDAKSKMKMLEMPAPVLADPSIEDTTRMMVEAGAASFSATLASSELDSFQLKVDKTHVVVIKISEDDLRTVVDVPYNGNFHIYLDPEDAMRFVLRFQPSGDVLGDDSDVQPSKTPLNLSMLHLHAQSASTRDMIASTLRSFRAKHIANDDETKARDAERQYGGILVDKSMLQQSVDNSTTSDTASDSIDGGDEKPRHQSKPPPQAQHQDELVELKRQLASQAVVIKATQNERNLMAIAVEVRERKLEEQRDANKGLLAHVDALRAELKSVKVAVERSKKVESHAQALATELLQLRQDKLRLEAQVASIQTQEHAIEAQWIQADEDCRTVRAELAAQQAQHMKILEERNSLKAKTADLTKEMRRLLKNGRTLVDIETQLKERTQLQIDLALAKADVKRYEDEMNEFKDALNCHVKQRGMGDVEMQRVLSQNMELQRLVAHFSSSLTASQDEVAKLKKKLQEQSPMRVHMKTQRQLQTSTSFKRNEQVVFDEDDEDDEDESEDDAH
ncbi:Aste57867_6959 [Aphanomyces stellatus]|uniref:Aste57867_6959 protein n=1 Tax=Aphanomyces stellatus TaxID=120398 RepID=A0A485KFY5_9STRA|nr:hypothetical protein As57867_006937 [Aphanomyces stellatus]VFT83911.1 Aste57867_6959 [Aphanomyces stellatus]